MKRHEYGPGIWWMGTGRHVARKFRRLFRCAVCGLPWNARVHRGLR